MKTETEPVSETSCFLKILDDGQSHKNNIDWCQSFHVLSFLFVDLWRWCQ